MAIREGEEELIIPDFWIGRLQDALSLENAKGYLDDAVYHTLTVPPQSYRLEPYANKTGLLKFPDSYWSVFPMRLVRLSGWFKADANVSAPKIRFNWFNAKKGWIKTYWSGNIGSPPFDWTEFLVSKIIPPTARYMSIHFEATSGATVGKFWIDEPTIELAPLKPEYIMKYGIKKTFVNSITNGSQNIYTVGASDYLFLQTAELNLMQAVVGVLQGRIYEFYDTTEENFLYVEAASGELFAEACHTYPLLLEIPPNHTLRLWAGANTTARSNMVGFVIGG